MGQTKREEMAKASRQTLPIFMHCLETIQYQKLNHNAFKIKEHKEATITSITATKLSVIDLYYSSNFAFLVSSVINVRTCEICLCQICEF